MDILIEIIPAYERQEDVLDLVIEYTNSIRKESPEIADCLKSQKLGDEVKDLEHK